MLPQENSIVFAQVVRVSRRAARLVILGSEVGSFPDRFPAILRQTDVRSFNPDAVDMYASFKPQDIVRARVISLGDMSNFYLSTASDDLGVCFAFSKDGHVLVPVNWEEMQCSGTKKIELRKVAKPVLE
ncbi:hypothetical protein P9112_002130 [Eukaryota sp. TZLM1-RC]